MTVEELQARLKAFALMLRFGHDLFGAKDFDAAATMAASKRSGLLLQLIHSYSLPILLRLSRP